MKIRQITIMAGPKGTFQPGTVHEVDDKEGAELVKGGYAEEVRENPKAVTAQQKAEKAVLHPAEEKRGNTEDQSHKNKK